MTTTRNFAIDTKWGHADQTKSILHRHLKQLKTTETYVLDLLPQYVLADIDI